MRVFLTGATGFVGSAVVDELIGAGHQVLGLTRSDKGAAALTAQGAEPHRGDLTDLGSLRAGARDADAVIHCGFNHDFSRFEQNCADDRRAIEAMGAELEGSQRPLIATSGLALDTKGAVATEADKPSPHFPRVTEAAVAAIAARGVRATTVRLAPSTHGLGDHGFVPILIGIAREKGASAYVGDGTNRWPGVHRRDAARLYRLAVEHMAAGGEAFPFHATDEEGVPFKDIAAVIGRRLGVPVVSKKAGTESPEEAEAHFGWFARFAAFDVPASSARTRAALGWTPREPGLLADLDQPGYFGG